MEQVQGSVRVKINECVHAWSEFLFVSLLVVFNFFSHKAFFIGNYYNVTILFL